MPKPLCSLFAFFLFVLHGTAGYASDQPLKDSLLYTDYRPEYTQWQDNYILDKIEYWNDRTIFFFRYKAEWEGGSATYYGPSGESPWYLKNLEPKPGIPNSFNLVDVQNIRAGGVLRNRTLRNKPEFALPQVVGEMQTAEIVFPRLPVGLTKVHLIEGRGNEDSERHFNALYIKVKPPGDPSLGTPKDMDKRIDNFEKGLPSEPEKQTEVVEEEEPEVVVQQPEPQPKAIEVPPPAPDNSVPPSNLTRLIFLSNGLRFSNPTVAYDRLENIRKQLLAHPSWKLNIIAYADANMGEEKALLLSQQRAETVFTYFATRGIAVDRLNKTGAGASGMIGPKGDGVNRRVEITFFR